MWKLDVEGFETKALKGAKDLLKNKKVTEYLREFGYYCHYFDRKGRLYRVSSLPDYHSDGLFLFDN